MAYMFVHDGLVHRRFPVGPIANVPYFRRVAAAHKVRTTATRPATDLSLTT
jgi:beta-carotene 3-hydroxylase